MGQMASTVKYGIRETMAFRANFLFLIIGLPIKVAVVWLFWEFITGSSAGLSGMSKQQIFLYVAFTSFLEYLYDTRFALQKMEIGLIQGVAVTSMTLPMSYHLREIYQSWGSQLVHLISGGVALVAAVLVMGLPVELNPAKAVLLTCIIILNGVLQYYIAAILASLAVLVGFTGSIKSMVIKVSIFFGGSILPLSFFPTGIRYMLYFNPFSSMIDLPASILVSSGIELGLVFPRLLILLAWIGGAMILHTKLWEISRERFTAPGE